jgi:steroid delta-isomerase-like uncharacterized protein
MSTETNKAIVRRIFNEIVNNNNADVADELCAPTYVNYGVPVPAKGPEALKMAVGLFRAAFPDIHVTLEQVVAEGDRVATHGYFTGTHRGDFNGIPATGKSIKASYIDLWRLENGKAAENWVQMDMLGLMQQLGVMPAPPA